MMGQEAEDAKGIIPRAFKHIFGYINGDTSGKKFLVRCSYLEIYNESILDLLGNTHDEKLDIK
jgi:Kinesin motor domain